VAYLLLILEPVEQRTGRNEAQGREAFEEMFQFSEELRKRGVLQAVESLTSQRDGARISRQAGDWRVIDGPFAEVKEMVGGFFLLDVKTLQEAIDIAKECPAARWCTVEVRKVGPCFL
jgi:hypothetical protein